MLIRGSYRQAGGVRIAGHLKVGMQERYSPLDRIVIPLCYNATRTMNTDEKILKALENLRGNRDKREEYPPYK